MKQRELKFKVWLYDEKKWGDPLVLAVLNTKELKYLYKNLDRTRIVQYTNFKDCDGIEIYEGDILERRDTGCETDGHIFTEVVRFHPFVPGWTGFYHTFEKTIPTDFETYQTKCKIVGNVFENFEKLNIEDTDMGNKHRQYILDWFEL